MRSLYLILIILLLNVHIFSAKTKKTNVLFIIADDLNCDLGAYGHYLVKTPHIDRLAAEGMLFENTYCNFPLSGPSRAGMMTGLYPDQTGHHKLRDLIRDHVPDAISMSQNFMNNGYTAARVGKIYHYDNPKGIGTPGHDDPTSWNERYYPKGIDKEMEDRIFSLVPGSFGAVLSWLPAEGRDEEHTDGMVATKAIELLEKYADNDTPFFLGVGFYKPHTPFVAPKKYFDLYPKERIRIPKVPADYLSTLPMSAVKSLTHFQVQNNLSDSLALCAIQGYYAAISFMDAQVGRVLEALDRLGLKENTIIVFTSDNGYHMGEHGYYQKNTLFENSGRIPLIISAPKMKEIGRSSASFAEMIDLYPTLSDLAGITPPPYLAGKSLKPILNNSKATVRESAFTQIESGYTLRTTDFRYTRWKEGGENRIELYNRKTDPEEMHNLAGKPGYEKQTELLNRLLEERIDAASTPPKGLHVNVKLYDLRTEYKINPSGLEVKNPELSWKMTSTALNQKQAAYQILVASEQEMLSPDKADLWNSRKIESDQSVHVRYEGTPLSAKRKYWWKVRIWDKDGKVSKWSEPATFETGMAGANDWQAEWIKTALVFSDYSYPSPYMRKEFAVSKKIKSARLYCTSRGLYEAYINGEKVGNQVFTPGYTSYEKRLQYQVYDVSNKLTTGINAIGMILGNGWYRAFNPNNLPMQDIQALELLAQLEITFADGTIQQIVTDNSWKSSTGAILKSELLDGEVYDARLYPEGWNRPGFNDNQWTGVIETQSTKNNLVSSPAEPIRKTGEMKAVKVIKTPNGETVFDMGQNMVGWSRLKINAPTGTVVTLRHAEILDQQGNFYTENLRGVKQEISYICKGGGVEVFEPHFTFHGFRYVAMEGYLGEATPDMVTGIVIHSDLDITGTFSCNNPLINQLQQNIAWGQKGNFLDVPTDCPQRNERLGWTGDIQVFAPTACFNMNVFSFLRKWLKDLAVDQYPNGKVPHVIPDLLSSRQRAGAAGWADAALIVPWNLYLSYGSRTVLEEQYESMKGWVDFMDQDTKNSNLWLPEKDQFGDWLSYISTRPISPGAITDKDLLASAYFFHSTSILVQTAALLGKTTDAEKYTNLQQKIKKAFVDEFITPNGRITSNTQTAYVVALSFGLIPEELEAKAARRLADDVRQYGHITTGFLGTADICHVLTKYGYLEEAYQLLYRKEYPSWLYPVTKGATTIWERWDGIRADGSFQNPSMNSFNHYAYGAIGDWLYRVVAGIRPDSKNAGYKDIILKPYPYGEMNNVKAAYESPYGKIASEWSVANGIIRWTVTIPVNTTAQLFIPSIDSEVKENGKTLSGLQVYKENNLPYHFLCIEKGSGQYTFETSLNY